ncbi:MAG: GNAT family N-acetyltransferase [Oscillospiraceae bacterium]|nr:GNAT family N-acetyltransferase [Oscillospiraceae bacterium]
MVRLRKMTGEEFQRFKEYSIADYAKDLIRGKGLDREQALSESEKDFEGSLPEGTETEGQFLMTIEDGQRRTGVGWIWFFYETEDGIRQVWLNDFLIHEDERRKGYATAAISEMERIAKNDGCARSALLVWDHNPAGYDLYRKCGYGTAKQMQGGSVMKKDL